MEQNKSRPKHPIGLKGREIGMFYKNRQRTNKPKSTLVDYGPSISLSERTLHEINKLLNKYHTAADDAQISDQFERRFQDLLQKNFHEFIVSRHCEHGQHSDNPMLNEKYINELSSRRVTDEYQRRWQCRKSLPAMTHRRQILEAIHKNQVLLVVGNTGCGKTTQIPQFILDNQIEAFKGSRCQIAVTQPRRISAITVAERVAFERNEKLGNSVGYQIRLQGVTPRPNGSILYCTTGTLLRRMEADPLLYGLSHIILDEIHERSVETDMLMGLIKKILPYREDLKVILMSATVSENEFREYFSECSTIEIHGTLFEVKVRYLEDVLQMTGFRNFDSVRKLHRHQKAATDEKTLQYKALIEPHLRIIEHYYDNHVIQSMRNPNSEELNVELIESLVFHICEKKPSGAILVFLPSYDKIAKVNTALVNSKHFRRTEHNIFTLHSTMPTLDQKYVFYPPPQGVRKIILATNIAESSVTIDDVVYVINSGKMKVTDLDVEQNLQTLEERWHTLANAHQRRGRAGRVKPGICFNLYSRAREERMPSYPTPEILRTKLDSVLLNLKLLHINDVGGFMRTLIDCPCEKAISNGIDILKRINALDEFEVITPLGMHLARLPIDPQMGKMILMGALFRCLDPITTVASALAFKDPFYRPLGKEQTVDAMKKRLSVDTKSDHLMIMNVINEYRRSLERNDEKGFCYSNFLSQTTLDQLEKMKQQFCEILESSRFIESANPRADLSNVNSLNVTLLRAVIAAGLYPNVAHLKKVRQIKNRVQPIHSMWTPTDRSVKFHPSSVNCSERSFDSHFFAYFLKQRSNEVYLMDTTMIFPMALIIFGDGVNCDVDRNGRHYLSVANFFFFKSDLETNVLIMRLRQSLRLLLQKKALYPSPIDFNSKDEILINALKILLSHDEVIDDDEDLDDD